MPVGKDGELWARGYVVMKGYYQMPDATAAAITKDGWLRSGDQASIDRDGRVRITGRIKDIIIRGGENIAPKEVEDVLRTHPAIADASVYAVTSEFFGEEVAAALRLHPGATIVPDEVTVVLSRAHREVQSAALHHGRRRVPADGVRQDSEVPPARSARSRTQGDIIRAALVAVFLAAGVMPAFAQSPDLIDADRPGLADTSTVIGRGRMQIETGLQWESNDGETLVLFPDALSRRPVRIASRRVIEGNTLTAWVDAAWQSGSRA